MLLGIIGEPKEESFRHAQEKGLSFLEFCINIGQDCGAFATRAEDIRAWMERYGVFVGAIGRWGTDKFDQNGTLIEEELQNSFQLIDTAAVLGCKVFNTGVNFVEELSYYQNVTNAIQYLQKCVDYGAQRGVRVATYNCRWNNFVVEPEVWKLTHGHIPELGIKFDSSHSIRHGGDYLAEIRDWGGRFYHVHIKGILMVDDDEVDDPPAGMDSTNWGALMAGLYKAGYDRLLSLEPHSSTWKGALGEKGLDYSIDYMRRLIF